MAHPMQHYGERKPPSELKVPTPILEILKPAWVPDGKGGHTNGTNLALRWWIDKEEFGVQTQVPQHETNPSEHYEAMAMQYLINEFVKWVNERDAD